MKMLLRRWLPNSERNERTDAVVQRAQQVKQRSDEVMRKLTDSYRKMDERLCHR